MHDIIPYYDHSLSLYIYIHIYTYVYCYLYLPWVGKPCQPWKAQCSASTNRSFPDEPVAETPVYTAAMDVWFREAERAWTVISMGNHLEMIAWKWQEFKDATSNDELDLYHNTFHHEWQEQPIGRHVGKFLVKALGANMNLSQDKKCARFVEAWFVKSFKLSGYDRWLASWVKYLARQLCTLLSRCTVEWREPQNWQDLEVLARANNLA